MTTSGQDFLHALRKVADHTKVGREAFSYGPANGRPTRCGTCRYGGGRYGDDNCGLFEMVNQALPAVFELDQAIKPTMRCNAWTAP